MAKKKSLLRKAAVIGSAGLLSSYIGTEMNKALKRYDLKEKSFKSEHLNFNQLKGSEDTKAPGQRYHEFKIQDKAWKDLGTCRLYMSQETDSFYGGHIRIAGEFTPELQKEIYARLIELAKVQLMDHLYFIADPKDAAAIRLYESVGAVLNKEIKIPADSPYYIPKHAKVLQYKLDLVPEEIRKRMGGKKNS